LSLPNPELPNEAFTLYLGELKEAMKLSGTSSKLSEAAFAVMEKRNNTEKNICFIINWLFFELDFH